jgi:hypothetical protein
MKNVYLIKLSFIISVLGILILFFIMISKEPELKTLNEVKNLSNENVKVIGKISKIKNYPNFQILTLKDSTDSLLALVSPPSKVELKENYTLELTGLITEYKNETEIRINNIKILSKN